MSVEPDESKPICWKTNLVLVWLSQFLSLSGFLFVIPFAPFYLESLGVTDKDDLYFYSALFVSVAPISFAIMGPIWGRIGDRYGRKIMMLRAYFGGALILFLMGTVREIGDWTGISPVLLLMVLRGLQGVFAGTVAAAQALVATSTPEQRQGLALGSLTAAVNAGLASGVFFGGLIARYTDYAMAAKIGGGIVLTAAILVLFGVRENFTAPVEDADGAHDSATDAVGAKSGVGSSLLASIGPGLPLLILMAFISIAINISRPILPLFVRELIGGDSATATLMTGYVSALGSIGLALSGVLIGILADRLKPTTIGKIAAIASACFAILIGLCPSMGYLFAFYAGIMFFVGGLDPAFQAWLSRITTKERRGSVFGWATSFRSLGWFIGPMMAAQLASGLDNLRAPFFLQGAWFLCSLPLIGWAARRMAARAEERNQDS